jgi:hypothetical protein
MVMLGGAERIEEADGEEDEKKGDDIGFVDADGRLEVGVRSDGGIGHGGDRTEVLISGGRVDRLVKDLGG